MYTTRPPDPDAWTDLDWIDITRTSAQSTVAETERDMRMCIRGLALFPLCPFLSLLRRGIRLVVEERESSITLRSPIMNEGSGASGYQTSQQKTLLEASPACLAGWA